MSTSPHPVCRNCGEPPAAHSPLGLCSRCLMGQLMGPEKDEAPLVVGDEIARGGMGTVYQAHDSELDREVALKVLREPDAAPDTSLRFEREARVLARLEHPNIVPIHALGEHDGQPCYSMKLVRGQTLQAIINGIRKSEQTSHRLDDLLEVFLRVCDAIAFAHSRGVIHRDLKPENVMVGEFGEVLVMDWGLAKILDADDVVLSTEPGMPGMAGMANQDPALTMEGAVMGTPQFMAPEQAEGRVDDIDARTDVFALGAILYSILTLRPPVRGKSVKEVLAKVRSGSISPPTTYNPSERRKTADVGDSFARSTTWLPHCPHGRIPTALSRVTMRALATSAEERYASAQELQTDITAFRGGFATSVEEIGTLGQLWLLIRRHRVVSCLLFAMVLLSLGFMLRLMESTRQANSAKVQAVAAGRELADTLDRVMLDRAEEFYTTDRSAAAIAFLSAVHRNSPTNRVVANRLVAAIQARNFLVPLTPPMRHPGWVRQIRFDHGGKRLVSVCDDGVARVWDPDSGEEIFASVKHLGLLAAAMPEDEDRLLTIFLEGRREHDLKSGVFAGLGRPFGTLPIFAAFDDRGKEFIVGFQGWGVRGFTNTYVRPLYAVETRRKLEWALRIRHGEAVAIARSDGVVQIWQISPKKLLVQLPHRGQVRSLDYEPNRDWLLTASESGIARLWDAKAGRAVGSEMKHSQPVSTARFAPDGSRIATASADGTAIIWNTNGISLAILPHGNDVADVRFSPDGALLATASFDHTARLWDSTTGEPRSEPMRHLDGVISAVFHPDGDRVATCARDGTVRVWRIGGRTPLLRQLTQGTRVRHCEFSSDGKLFAIAGDDGVARVWNTESADEPVSFEHKKGVSWVAFSADSQQFVTAGRGGNAKVWNIRDAVLSTEVSIKSKCWQAHFSPFGNELLVSGIHSNAYVFALPGGELKFRTGAQCDKVRVAAWNHSGNRIVTGSLDGTLRIWDAANGQPVGGTMNHGEQIASVVFSPDDTRILSAGLRRSARLWDGRTGASIGQPMKHEGWVASAEFSADGGQIVTASYDFTARIWDAASGAAITPPMRHAEQVNHACFAPDGRRIVSACDDGTIRFWDSRSGAALSEPIRLDSAGKRILWIRFSPAGNQLIAGGDSGSWLIQAPFQSDAPAPDWLPDFAEAVAGQRPGEHQTLSTVPAGRLARLISNLQTAGENDPYAKWARDFLPAPPRRQLEGK